MAETSHSRSLRTVRRTPHSWCGSHHHCTGAGRGTSLQWIDGSSGKRVRMKGHGVVLVTVALLAVALTVGTASAATADPPPLDAVVLTAHQAGPGYVRYTMNGGR